ncbi:MAG: DUF2868 domain-containing protein [Desulfotignum sp.]
MTYTLTDIMDLDFLLALDEQADTPEHTRTVAARDRDIFCQLDTADLSEKDLIMSWLAYRKLVFFDQTGQKGQWQLPGKIFSLLYRWMAWALILLGGITGMGMAYAFLAYHGVRPVNVTLFFTVFVLLPAVLFLSTLAGLFLRRYGLFRSGPGFVFTLVSGFLFKVLPRFVERSVKKTGRLPGSAGKASLDTALYFIRTRKQEYGFLFFWPLVILLSLSALFFSFGALGATLFRVAVTDVAFGWQSTVISTPSFVHEIVSLVAFPWAAWVPDHLAGPTLAQIEGSRILLKQGMAFLATEDLVSWWPFLCFGMVFYAIVPRLFLLLAAGYAQKSLLEQYDFHQPRFRRLVVRMKSPVMDIRCNEIPVTEAVPATAVDDRKILHQKGYSFRKVEDTKRQAGNTQAADSISDLSSRAGVTAAAVAPTLAAVLVPASIWDENARDRIRVLIRQQFLLDVQTVIPVDLDPETDTAVLQEKIPAGADPIIFLQEVWQPPIRGLLHYLVQLKQGVLADKNLWVLLTQAPEDKHLAVSVDDADFAVWQTSITRLGRPDMLVERIRP